MVSDSQLVAGLRQFLKTADLATTTTAIVRRRLEEEFGVDLTEKKAFIREQVDLFLQSQQENEKQEEDDDGGDASASEEEGEEEEEEDGDSDGEENGGRDGAGGSRKKAIVGNKRKGGGGGFTKLCGLSPELQKVLGVSKLPCTKVVQQIWAYIRENDLQDPENRRNIRCDKLLRSIFYTDSVNMFQMNKLLSKHILPLSPEEGNDELVTEEKPVKTERSMKEKGRDESKPKAKRLKKEKGESGKGRSSGLLAPLPLSDALVKFIGTGEDSLPRSEVVKRIWAYIKENELQDPADKRRIICDEKLKELFDVDSFTGFTVPKLLSAHFVKAEH